MTGVAVVPGTGDSLLSKPDGDRSEIEPGTRAAAVVRIGSAPAGPAGWSGTEPDGRATSVR